MTQQRDTAVENRGCVTSIEKDCGIRMRASGCNRRIRHQEIRDAATPPSIARGRHRQERGMTERRGEEADFPSVRRGIVEVLERASFTERGIGASQNRPIGKPGVGTSTSTPPLSSLSLSSQLD